MEEEMRRFLSFAGRKKYRVKVAGDLDEILRAHIDVPSCMHPLGEYPHGALAVAGGPAITLIAEKTGK